MRTKPLIALASTLALAAAIGLTACGGGGGSGGSGGSTGASGGSGGSGGNACDKLPAAGMNQVVQPSTNTTDGTDVGYGAALALLNDGSPILAYGTHDLQGNDKVYVIRWDPCAGAWSDAVLVDSVSVLSGIRPIGIAVDASDGRVVVAYDKSHLIQMPNPTEQIFVATSTDGGKTFTTEPVSRHCVEDPGCAKFGDVEDASNPQIAAANGKTYVVYNQLGVGCGAGDPAPCQDTTVLATKDGAGWTREVVKDGVDPIYGGAIYADVTFPPALALDSAGQPGVLAFQHPNQSASPISYTWALYFARPGQTAVRVFDSEDAQNDVGTGSSSLWFEGTKVRALAHLHDQPAGTETHDLLFSKSDDGVTFTPKVALPRDGDDATASSQALLGDGSGGLIAVAQAVGGSTNQFGQPKILRSTDGASWTLSGAGDAASALHPNSVTAARGKDDKLWIAFDGTAPQSSLYGGVVVWREP